MKKRILTAASFFVAALIAVAASVGDVSPKLKAFADVMGSAQGFTAKYTVQPIGGTAVEYSVAFSKPDKAMIDTPDTTTVADGKSITTFDKNENTYYKKPQTEAELMGMFSSFELSVWKPFFKPDVVKAYTSSRDTGTKARGGKTLNVVNVQIDPKGDMSVKLYTDSTDNTLCQGEITSSSSGQDAKTSLILVTESAMTAAADLFVFKAPDGAKELTPEELMSDKWLTDFEQAQKLAAQFNKGLIVDFYADW